VERNQNDGTVEYLLHRRPDTGLLAGLWEFPCVDLTTDKDDDPHGMKHFHSLYPSHKLSQGHFQFLNSIVHLFSHIRKTYHITIIRIQANTQLKSDTQHVWTTEQTMIEYGKSSAMKKAFQQFKRVGKRKRNPK
jgi:A/G-specific adenine glycosylase